MPKKCTIEAFILTYNRKDFLKDSIQSLLNQTVENLKITVMDNGSSDGTEELVHELQQSHTNLFYHKREINNPEENLRDAINLAQKDYLILFHDDDILHPDYLKNAISVINRYPKVSIVSNVYKEYTNPNNENWEKVSKNFYYCKDKNEFVDYLCYMQKFAFCSVIYKTSNLKELVNNMPDEKRFGKVGDKPFVVDTMHENDAAIIFKDKHLLRYRVHAGQDTKTAGPYYDELIEFNKFYKSFMQRNWYSIFLFNLINYKQLKCGYVWGNDNTLSLNEFIQKAIDEGAGCFYTKLCISKFGCFFIEVAHILRKIFKSTCKSKFDF